MTKNFALLSGAVRAQYRVNSERKEKAEAILEAQGIRPSQAIDMFFAEVVRGGGFPFKPCPISDCGELNTKMQNALKQPELKKDVRTFKNKHDFFDSLKKL